MKDVSEIYDQLFVFESSRHNGYYPIHKKLKLDGEQEDLIDWIMDNVSFKPDDSVLDAGCGTGNTLIRLAKEKKVRGLGISISTNEINYAKELLSKDPKVMEVSFKKQSFDDPIAGSFNKIIAIESLKHSDHLEKSISNLTSSISQNGMMIIADDFEKGKSQLIEWQKKLWKAKSFTNVTELEQIYSKIGQYKLKKIDLTSKVKSKSIYILIPLISFIYIVRLFSIKKFRAKIEIYLGGLLLEFLYKTEKVSYFVIMATKLS
jgi:cyclopropane fatty-acyl-phospholipid synthase-like methyltransferase